MKSWVKGVLGIGVVGVAGVAGYAVLQSSREEAYYAEVDQARERSDASGFALPANIHRPFPGERGAEDNVYFPENTRADGQQLTSACLVNCGNFDSTPVVLRPTPEVNDRYETFASWKRVATLSISERGFDDFGLVANSTNPVQHDLQIKTTVNSTETSPEFEAQVVRPDRSVKPLKVKWIPAPTGLNVPATAEFFWYPRGAARKDVPLIGIKCPNGWCFIGENAVDSPAWSADGKTVQRCTDDAARTTCAAFFGTHDEQQLSVNEKGRLKRGSSWGLILADPQLGTYDIPAYKNTWRRVASARIWKTKYKNLPNDTQLFVALIHESDAPTSDWYAKIYRMNGSQEDILYDHVKVDREEYGQGELLSLVRWGYDPNDEGVWVRCGVGCCYIKL